MCIVILTVITHTHCVSFVVVLGTAMCDGRGKIIHREAHLDVVVLSSEDLRRGYMPHQIGQSRDDRDESVAVWR
jgi:hypothetical protein